MVGSDVWLSCIYPKGNSFDLNDLYVYWQISVPGKRNTNSVVTYYLSGNSSAGHGDNHYKGRARLSLDGMKQGNFSLHLHNVTPQDEQKFNCLVFRKSLELEKILEVTVTLNVAANYSMPVVSGPSQDEEFIFTCTSTNGYPRPNVPGLLSFPAETFTGTKDSITEDPVDDTQDAVKPPVLSVLAVLVVAVAVAVATGWLCRSRCPSRSYAGIGEARAADTAHLFCWGAQAARPELELTGQFARREGDPWRNCRSPGSGELGTPLSLCPPFRTGDSGARGCLVPQQIPSRGHFQTMRDTACQRIRAC
ncbi:hypothetical protein E2I00_019751 [Balaenoptera physalus]|uniref:Ig-like domain-containing protein n=1 Tax=Balaenoptera physalus TaxID=9770 RepID=A0A643CD27_BALPH|nr:hypothetical protein E2I00_019751 [Balaenoptera physalus]